MDSIHERYVCYANQSQTQRDLTKTDYTYAKSWSYRTSFDRTQAFVWHWDVPNMCRRSISFCKSKFFSKDNYFLLNMESEEQNNFGRNGTNGCAFDNYINETNFKDFRTLCLKTWIFFTLLLFLWPLMYAINHYMSCPFKMWSLDQLMSDMPSKYAIETMEDYNNEREKKLLDLNNKMDKIEDIVNNIVKKCCKTGTDSMLALIDMRLSAFMSQMMSNNQNSRQSMSPQEVAQELKAFMNLELSKTNDVFKEEVKSLISQALAIYAADRTGQTDYALESAGGTVINSRCSQTYSSTSIRYELLGIPFWSSCVSPSAVIQPSISPGECWAFSGSTGHLVIKLSQPITPTAFSYEHIPKQISRDGNIDSAPKEFQVRGLDDESDTSGHLLGNYVYEDNNTPMQFFEVQDPNPRPLQYIELVVLSNHGHNQYTCLYRFRVHGKPVLK